MFSSLSRDQIQIVSLTLFSIGAGTLLFGGWQSELARSLGIVLTAASIWLLMMSDSVFLSKVQNEMHKSLEDMSRKRESEIQDLLYFLRDSQISASPLDSIIGAKKLCNKFGFPSMVIATNYQIIKANKHMHDLLGWNKNELNGKPAYSINEVMVMSKIGEICQRPEYVDKEVMSTEYAYVCRDGSRVHGHMSAVKIGSDGFLVTFHPESANILNAKEVKDLL